MGSVSSGRRSESGIYFRGVDFGTRQRADWRPRSSFHHVSRHISDRPKPFSIAWNVLAAALHLRGGRQQHDGRPGGRGRPSCSTRTWTTRGSARSTPSAASDQQPRRTVRSGTGQLFARRRSWPAAAGRRGPDRAGIRLKGGGGVMESSPDTEKRVDADPWTASSSDGVLAGVRLLSADNRTMPRLSIAGCGADGGGVILPPPPMPASAASRPPKLQYQITDAAQRADGRPVGGSLDADRARAARGITSARRTRSRAAPASRTCSST